MSVDDFDFEYRCRMVKAYPVISGIRDLMGITVEELDAGFQRCLDSRNLLRVHELYLAGQVSA